MKIPGTRWVMPVALAALAACSSSSQQAGVGAGMAPIEGQDVVHEYTVPSGEFIRIPLDAGATYRVELDGTGFRLGIKPVDPGTQPPLVEELVPGVAASGTVLYSVRPRADGLYEVRSIAGDPTRPMTMSIRRESGPAKD